MMNVRSSVRRTIAGVTAAGLIFAAAPARAQVTPQPSSPIQLMQCDFATFGGGIYNTQIHYDLLASFVDRSTRAAKLVGITAEFYDEQGNVMKKLDAAYSGRFDPGRAIDHLRFSLGAAPNPTAAQRCFVARVEFDDGSVWSVADHYAEVERPPTKCRVAVKDGTTFEAAWNGALCVAARETWDAAHRPPVASQPH